MGIVVRNIPFKDISPMMVPLKKMKYLDVDVYVPNNPIAYLEKEFEQGNDVGVIINCNVGFARSKCV